MASVPCVVDGGVLYGSTFSSAGAFSAISLGWAPAAASAARFASSDFFLGPSSFKFRTPCFVSTTTALVISPLWLSTSWSLNTASGTGGNEVNLVAEGQE